VTGGVGFGMTSPSYVPPRLPRLDMSGMKALAGGDSGGITLALFKQFDARFLQRPGVDAAMRWWFIRRVANGGAILAPPQLVLPLNKVGTAFAGS
jgi:hypothetical protein